VFPRHKLAVFVHGCFWHGHGCKRGGKGPKSNVDYWRPKIARTQNRDKAAQAALRELGWRVAVVWECELKSDDEVARLIQKAIGAAHD
jgi:DNA mismatch endonuclease (patch repair protein)